MASTNNPISMSTLPPTTPSQHAPADDVFARVEQSTSRHGVLTDGVLESSIPVTIERLDEIMSSDKPNGAVAQVLARDLATMGEKLDAPEIKTAADKSGKTALVGKTQDNIRKALSNPRLVELGIDPTSGRKKTGHY